MQRISVEEEGATLECLQGGLCVFQGNLVFLPSGSSVIYYCSNNNVLAGNVPCIFPHYVIL